MFTTAGPLDFVAIQRDVLQFWTQHDVFRALVAKNRGGPRYSFLDGPITANNPMGVHHAWGRTYKDLFQRYRAMRGFEQRFQNGFDCQGLWVEVEVEKALGFGGKREIEAMGLAPFARACRERVERFAALQTRQSQRLGQWMDWERSYLTMADRNIEYIWHFLGECQRKGWLYLGHRVMPWCVRCGTSISQHEMLEAYAGVTHQGVVVALPLAGHAGASLLVWTTTAWTLPANVAVAVHPELDYEAVAVGDRPYYLAADARPRFPRLRDVRERVPGARLVGLRYHGPFDELTAQRGIEHRVVAWDQVSAGEGTGLVHIAPGCGQEDFELGRREGLAALAPLDDDGRYLDSFGAFAGRDALRAGGEVIAALQARGMLHEQRPYRHRYPTCWRCGEELVFRLVDEWFIRADELRPLALAANAEVRWHPGYMRRRMDDWLANMADWCISRKRYWGLPLPFYPCPACQRLTVVASRRELRERAVDPAAVDALPELHRPWIDGVALRCPECGHEVRRIAEVGDCWLDAGIVPFSTLGYLEDREHWARWFPADLVVEMAAQLRGWFYALLFMAVTLEGRAPYRAVVAHEKVLGEDGREMHKSWGNAVWFDEAVETMGADVIRYLFASASITEPLRFGEGAGREVKRKFLTLWNVYTLFLTYAGLDRPELPADAAPPAAPTGLERWVLARLQSVVREVGAALDAYQPRRALLAAEEFIQQDLSNWYVRRRRRLFWKGERSAHKAAAYRTLHHVLVRACQLLAPVTPFVTEHMYRTLVAGRPLAAPLSVHLTAFPEPDHALEDPDVEAGVALVRRVLSVGLAARNAARIKVRQPLARAIVHTASDLARWLPDFESDLREELNVEAVETVASAEDLPGEGGFASASEADITVALDTVLTGALRRKGVVRHLVHQVQLLRKSAGLNVDDRIDVFVAADDAVRAAVEEHPADAAVQEVRLEGGRAVLGVRTVVP
jgi:isoleucyl-tRNA synthetase